MSSSQLGENTSIVEVTNISSHGIWLYAHGIEYFLSYREYPWFEDKTVREIIREESTGHYYWPDLDVDLSQGILENPEKYPLETKRT